VLADPAEPLSGSVAARERETYEVFGEVYAVLGSSVGYRETGVASWYGQEFAGRPTSSGEIFDPRKLTAAHRSLPLHTWVEVTNLRNGRKVVLKVNDRGPFVDTEDRIIDVSHEAARVLGLVGPGIGPVEVRALPADAGGSLRRR
jgi:rare lipoprotein A